LLMQYAVKNPYWYTKKLYQTIHKIKVRTLFYGCATVSPHSWQVWPTLMALLRGLSWWWTISHLVKYAWPFRSRGMRLASPQCAKTSLCCECQTNAGVDFVLLADIDPIGV
jgi:hypothetical protein